MQIKVMGKLSCTNLEKLKVLLNSIPCSSRNKKTKTKTKNSENVNQLLNKVKVRVGEETFSPIELLENRKGNGQETVG